MHDEYFVESFYHAQCAVSVSQDPDAESPDTWEEDIILRAYHRQFQVDGITRRRDGTIHFATLGMTREEAVQFYEETCKANARKQACEWEVFPLYAYIHSGVVLSVGEPDWRWPDQRWDVSHLGWVAVRKSAFRGHAKRYAVAKSYVETWNQYLEGDVYSVYVTHVPTGESDSLSGIYGIREAREEGRLMAEQLKERTARAHVPVSTPITPGAACSGAL